MRTSGAHVDPRVVALNGRTPPLQSGVGWRGDSGKQLTCSLHTWTQPAVSSKGRVTSFPQHCTLWAKQNKMESSKKKSFWKCGPHSYSISDLLERLKRSLHVLHSKLRLRVALDHQAKESVLVWLKSQIFPIYQRQWFADDGALLKNVLASEKPNRHKSD